LRRVAERRQKNGDKNGAASPGKSKYQSQGVLCIERMCQAGGVSRAEFYPG
jgi:hypothetical protein